MTSVSEEEEELYQLVMRTEHECAVCCEKICFTDEIVVLTVVVMTLEIVDGELKVSYSPMEADDGDFLYEPRFLEYECWEDTVDEMVSQLEDKPPIEDPESAVECRICKSGIRLGELMGLATKGELLSSARLPDGMPSTTFDAQDPQPDPVCVACLRFMSTNIVDLWESVEHNDECEEGTEIRCWRQGCQGKAGCILNQG
jgi:hypothetical protein